jgi:hypothetical protein
MKPINRISRPIPAQPDTQGCKNLNINVAMLDAVQVLAIDRALQQIGEFGEIHLIVKRGRVRFIGTLKTEAIDSQD